MKKCPRCGKPLEKKLEELEDGMFSVVWVCPTCRHTHMNGKSLFIRKAFRIGGSLAVRIPKEVANTIGIKEGSTLDIDLQNGAILLRPK